MKKTAAQTPIRTTQTTDNRHFNVLERGSLRLRLERSVGVATYPPGATFGPRRMRDYEFVWLIQGNAEYRRAKNWVAAPQGSIVLCRPGAVDAFRWDPNHRTRHGFFHFQIESLPSHWPPPESWPLVRTPENEDLLLSLFRYVLAGSPENDATTHLLAVELMIQAFIAGSSVEAPPLHDTLPEPVERASNFLFARLEADPAAKITLQDLARAAYVSPEHLCRIFKEATGHPPLETVRLARLDRAAVLLTRSNYSINEIAAMCGFASPFHFSRRFKEAYTLSPRSLRQAIREGETPPLPRLARTNNRI